ncbi:hypothetical protein BDU57DRAFT_585615 [Ampelomyces quisqualis]|uniref:Short chain dehydrogenase n=1 Tax=Ampelomyces quisqualis TaxID=50730 RepID=A0A6A5R018_AMPQU|nr:hypothetical protein BDU57DRAFT_585615 [Ampelomyces quisqualis]
MAEPTKYTSKLSGSRLLIIGSSSGIGFAVAEACIEHGALVVIASCSHKRISSAIERIKSTYPSKAVNIHGLTVDLSNPEALESELEHVLSKAVVVCVSSGDGKRKLNHIIYTAGDALATIPLPDMTSKTLPRPDKFLNEHLEKCPDSSYTITTGSISEKPMPDWTVVAGYAAGLHAMVRNLALELKPIRVNGISSGVVNTELWKMSEEERETMMTSMGENLATGRAGRPEDVAESYLAVLKDGNMTGSMVQTDGGALFM